ncbi:MAG: ATP-binding cassette domain-containing protein [Planctomycetota bacterium]
MAERIDSDQPAVRLEMWGICKRFGATVALDDVGIRVAGGQVLALVGEYGPGKSTLMKVLSGAVKADALNSVKPIHAHRSLLRT